MGEMILCLSSSGNIPVLKELSIMLDITVVRWVAIDYKDLVPLALVTVGARLLHNTYFPFHPVVGHPLDFFQTLFRPFFDVVDPHIFRYTTTSSFYISLWY